MRSAQFVILALTVPVIAFAQRGRGGALPRSNNGPYGALSYRFIGPPGNRVISVAGIPGNSATYYVGAASGGIWKTTDAGTTWRPIFDSQPVSSIGALAIAPSDSNTIWAGTGESFIRSHISLGWGIFKSTDAGATWTKMGLDSTGRIARIVVHPTNPNIVLAAALGHAYGPQPHRGIYRTADGGRTWQRVLFVNDSAGGIDVVMHPSDPNTLFAATWQIEVKTWGRTSGGAGSGIWKSTDAGVTWSRMTGNGLPTRPYGKVGLAMSRANPQRVYALIETGKGVPWNGAPTDTGTLWRSDDGGTRWSLVNSNSNLVARPAYYTRMAANPDNADEAYFLAIGFSATRDGGATMLQGATGATPGFDNHDMWIDPLNGNRMIVGNDEGVSISITRGRSWNRIRLPIAQIYRVSTDNRIPYTVCGNMQDGPSTCGPSNSKSTGAVITGGAEIPRGLWYSVLGGESGAATPDPVNADIIWSTASGRGSVGGIVTRYNMRGRTGRDVEVWPVNTGGHAARDLRYRFVWDFPIAISPHDNNTVYVGSQHVHRTTNGGQRWEVISPDLTLNDKSKQGLSGGIWHDNIGVEYGDVLYAIAESPVTRGLIWAGSNDGLVHITRDGGRTWTNVTRNIPGIITWGTIGNIEPSRHNAGTAYLTVNGHQEGNFDPWVYRTRDYGQTWQLIVNGIPKTPLSFARIVREDPVRRGLLYLGLENALYVSFNDGEQWEPLQLDLPPAPVSWMTIQRTFNDLVISTYGRGFYILDDVTPLQQLTPEVRASASHLFTPRQAYRFRLFDTMVREQSEDPSAGRNPPYGASLNYWLGSVPSQDVSLAIADSVGRTIRTLPGPKVAGINRVMWDLQFNLLASGNAPAGRTAGAGPGGRAAGAGGGRGGPPSLNILAPPGRYTVRLRIGDREQSQPLVVMRDPDAASTPADLAAQQAMLVEVANDIASATVLNGSIENVRAQLRTLGQQVANDAANSDVKTQSEALALRFSALADTLVQPLPGPFYERAVKLIVRLQYLATHLQTSDYGPTDQARESHEFLRGQLRLVRTEYAALVRNDLSTLNDLLR
ncbi:MAG TPA: hypothetical protein VF128_01490, partial [Gemmatimonadaceae bacterium]